MSRFSSVLLVIFALLAGLLLVAACDGGDEDEEATPTAIEEAEEPTPEEEETPPAREEREDGGEAFEDIPVPEGADETESGRFTGTLPFAVPGAEVDPEAYTSVEFKEYEVDASPEDIIAFYRDRMQGWDETFVFSGGTGEDEGGFGVWTRGDGRVAVWLVAERSDGGATLTIIRGSTE